MCKHERTTVSLAYSIVVRYSPLACARACRLPAPPALMLALMHGPIRCVLHLRRLPKRLPALMAWAKSTHCRLSSQSVRYTQEGGGVHAWWTLGVGGAGGALVSAAPAGPYLWQRGG